MPKLSIARPAKKEGWMQDKDVKFAKDNIPNPLTTFPLFQFLPAELRQKIWEYALPGRRTISITLEGEKYVLRERGVISRPPVLLSVNQEAREVALRTYDLILRSVSKNGFYFDFAKDILHISACYPRWADDLAKKTEELGKVQHLAIFGKSVTRPPSRLHLLIRLMPFPHLKTLFLGNSGDNPFGPYSVCRQLRSSALMALCNHVAGMVVEIAWRKLQEYGEKQGMHEAFRGQEIFFVRG